MSASRFAPITAALFVRKGEAVPSVPKPSLFWTREPPLAPPEPELEPEPEPVFRQAAFAAPPPPPPSDGKPHRVMLTLSATEFEKLGIAAVKKGLTRHQILRTALDTHLERLKREYGGCGCMAMRGSCQDGCGGA